MKSLKEVILPQGQSKQGIVRIGNTVHRPIDSNSEFTHKLLQLLEEKKYPYSPRFLGLDEKGREILTFVEGNIGRGKVEWTNEQLTKIVNMIKEFHNATGGSDFAGDKEVVCHNDLAPWNLVVVNDEPIAFIDFDDSAPGYRIDDLAYFLWTFLDLGIDIPVDIQAKKIRLLNNIYGSFNSKDLIDAILNQQKKILRKREYLSENADKQEEREFSKLKIDDIKSEIEWVKKNRENIIYILNK